MDKNGYDSVFNSVKKRTPNPNIEYARKASEIFYSTFIKKDYKDVSDLGGLFGYYYIDKRNKQRLIEYSKIHLYYFELDDQIESNATQMLPIWEYVFKYNKSLTDTPLEKMHEHCFKRVAKDLTKSQIKRYITANLGYLEALKISDEVYNTMSAKTFLRIRNLSGAIDHSFLAIEYCYDIPLTTEMKDNYLVGKYIELICFVAIVYNDLVSIKKELIATNVKNKLNYVQLIMNLHNCSVEQSVKFIIKEGKINYNSVLSYQKQIIGNKLNLPNELLYGYVLIIDGSKSWDVITKRYQ